MHCYSSPRCVRTHPSAASASPRPWPAPGAQRPAPTPPPREHPLPLARPRRCRCRCRRPCARAHAQHLPAPTPPHHCQSGDQPVHGPQPPLPPPRPRPACHAPRHRAHSCKARKCTRRVPYAHVGACVLVQLRACSMAVYSFLQVNWRQPDAASARGYCVWISGGAICLYGKAEFP